MSPCRTGYELKYMLSDMEWFAAGRGQAGSLSSGDARSHHLEELAMKRKGPAIALLLVSITPGLASCAEDEPATPKRDDPAIQEMREKALERKSIQKVEMPEETAPVTGEVPSGLVGKIREDLAQLTGGAEAELVAAEAVTWPDGSLGCGQPGRVYTQVPVPGYRVVFDVAGERWNYHASTTGGFMLCSGPNLKPGGVYPAQ